MEKFIDKIRSTFRIIGWLFGLYLILYFTGCSTVGIADLDSLDHQRRIATLERRVVDYERRLAEYDSLIGGTVERLEIIRERASGITDRIDRVIFLFEEYDREVNRLINSFNNSGGTTSQVAKNELLALVRYYSDVGIEDWKDNTWLRQAFNK